MAARPRLILAFALALSACTPPGTATPPTGGGRKSPAARASAVPSVAPSVPASGLVPTTGGGLISDQAGQLSTLEGVVRAPAGIIANNGGAIIANNGGGLITDNGAGLVTDNGAGVIANNGGSLKRYGLRAAEEQKPFGGVMVEIQDAKGQPVLDAAGKPIRAVTGPDGKYRVTAPLPARNLVAVVKLAEGHGALQAIVGRGAGVRKADVELVSSLTTGYILGKFVAGQADPVATLERLPPAIEAATRAKAAAALADGRAAAPAALTPTQVQATVDALRAGDKAFDAQMETVRKLLVAAGQSNLGDGLPATKVLLSSLHGVLPAPDGGLFLPSWTDRRLWRVLPDGTLRNVAGRGGEIDDPPGAGKPAREVGLGEIQAAGVDPQGRLVFADSDDTCRVWRVEADGTLKLLADLGSSLVFTMACAPDGTTWLVTARNGIMAADEEPPEEPEGDSGFDLEAIAPDGTRTIAWRGVPVMDELNGVGSGEPMYVGPGGELLFLGEDEDNHVAAIRVWPAEKRIEPIAPPPRPAIALDRTGAWYYRSGGAVRIKEAGGQDRVFLASPPPELDLEGVYAVPAPGGGTYFSDGALVYLVKDGVATLKAGLPAADAGVGGRETSLDPAGLAIRPDGTLLVAESTRGRVVTVAADGTIAAFIAPGGALKAPSIIRLDAAGALYATDGLAVKRIAPDGTATTLFTNPNAEAYAFDLQVAADGTAYVAYSDNPGFDIETEDGPPADAPKRTLWRLAPGKAAERLEVIAAGDDLAEAHEVFGMDAAGVLHLLRVAEDEGMADLLAWRDGAWKPVGAPLQGTEARDFISSFVLDAAGRIYVGFQDSAVVRYDVATGVGTTIAGKGGRIFLGTGVDDDAGTPFELQFDPKGDLLFLDSDNRQIKRIPKAKLD